MIGLPIGKVIFSAGSGVTYDADASTLFAAMSTPPDATRKALISDMFAALKAAGIFALLDRLYVMAAHTEQAGLLNWLNPAAGNLVAVNAPTFTADQGYAGNGTTSYLNTQFVPSTDGVQYTLNDASLGVYSRIDSAADVRDMGANNATNDNDTYVLMKFTDGKQYATVASDLNAAGASVSNSLGLGVSRRTSSTALSAFRNGASIATASVASQARPTVAMYIGARNENGTPGKFSTRQYAMAFVGASLSAGQQQSLYDIVQSYLTSIGAQV